MNQDPNNTLKHVNKEEIQEQERLRKEYEKLNIENNHVECHSSKQWLKMQGLKGIDSSFR